MLKDTNLNSEYKMKSQLSAYEPKYNKDAAHHVARIQNSQVQRNRPMIKVLDKAADSQTAQQRAQWQADRMGGESAKVDAVIQGHRLGGALVEPNKTVLVKSRFAHIDNEMLIERVTWSMDDGGSKANITLVPPKAYGGKAGASSGKAGAAKAADAGKVADASKAGAAANTIQPAAGYSGAQTSVAPTPAPGSPASPGVAVESFRGAR